jgi:hypothetical protein
VHGNPADTSIVPLRSLSPFPTSAQPEKIKHLLDNVELGTGKASIMEKIDGMKYLLAVSPWRWISRRKGRRVVASATAVPSLFDTSPATFHPRR